MAFIDGTAVNVALPVMQADLDASLSELQWVVAGYALFLAALLLVGGSLGDRLGRRRTFIWGVAIFAVASVGAGLAPNVQSLIVARAVQGVGGALFVPGSLALIGACFTDVERGRAVGTWSAMSGLTAAAGPLLGGWLAETLSWRWIFFINIPMALVVIGVAMARVPESRDETTGARTDWLGSALVTLGLSGVVYGLIASVDRGFSDTLVVGALVVGGIGLAGFLLVEARVRWPMMPLAMFRSRNFAGANFLSLLLYGALGGALFFVPLNLVQVQVQGYSPTEAGAAMLPFVLVLAVLSRWAGGLVTRVGAKLPLVAGPGIAGIGFLLFARPGIGDGYWTGYFPAVTAFGIGMAITISPLVTVVMGTVDQRLSGTASGINNAVSRTASLLAVAVFGVVALGFFNGSLDDKLLAIDAPPAAVEHLEAERGELAGADLPEGLTPEVEASLRRAIDESFVDAFRGIMLIAAGLAFTSSLVALVVVEPRVRRGVAADPGS